MDIEKLKPGTTVWDLQTRKMGNTAVKTKALFQVHVVEVDLKGRCVLASWNGNAPQWYRRGAFKGWKAAKPVLVSDGMFGRKRLATREERKRILEERRSRALSQTAGWFDLIVTPDPLA